MANQTKVRSLQESGGTSLTEQVATEERREDTNGWQQVKAYAYGPDGKPVSLDSTPLSGEDKTRYYTYNPHGDVEALTDPTTGDTTATYRYTAYGDTDDTGTTGEDKPTGDPTQDADVLNPYRYSGHRYNAATGTYDFGFRNYDPGLNRYLSRDMYNGALSDLALGLDPWNTNRYQLAGGNPISFIDLDGHYAIDDDGNMIPPSELQAPSSPGTPTQPNVDGGASDDDGYDPSLGYTRPGSCDPQGYSSCSYRATNDAGFLEVVQGIGQLGWKVGDAVVEGTVQDAWNCGRHGSIEGCAWTLASFFPAGRILRTADNALDAANAASRATNTGRVATNVCRANSFAGDTLVLMADGTKKPIKDIKLGDKVIATDPETGKTRLRKVVDLIRHGGWHTMVAVRLLDGTTIDATDRHPFWVESRGEWVDAIDLEPGDVLIAADGDRLTVTSMGISERDLTAYNLTVAGLHTYYAGGESVLVHNAGCTNITEAGLEHSFDRHAAQWFGGQPIKAAQMTEWQGLIEQAAGSSKVVPWSSGGTLTNAHLARIDGKYFAAQFDRETGDLVTAFAPNNDQLGAMLRLLGH